jgi:hypothetical protein
MSESYSFNALFESPTLGIYFITTMWSGCSLFGYKIGL